MKKFNIDNFMKLTPEEQAKEIEKETNALLKRLPTLKKQLKMYGETSDELYNLSEEEVNLMGTTYARAVRGGQITTPSSVKSYKQFIKMLRKYARTNMDTLTHETTTKRIDSWIEHIKASSSESDIAYAQEMLDSMTDEEKAGFTRSKFFMDSSYMYMVTEVDGVQYSIQTLKLELYLEEIRGKTTEHIYREHVKGNEDKLRKYQRRR